MTDKQRMQFYLLRGLSKLIRFAKEDTSWGMRSYRLVHYDKTYYFKSVKEIEDMRAKVRREVRSGIEGASS